METKRAQQNMEKDFDRWNSSKKRIDADLNEIDYHEREIWWCSIGVNVGSQNSITSRTKASRMANPIPGRKPKNHVANKMGMTRVVGNSTSGGVM